MGRAAAVLAVWCLGSLCCTGTLLGAAEGPEGLAALGITVSPPSAREGHSGYEHGLESAKEAYHQGRYARAFGHYKDARSLHPEDERDPEVLLMIADCAQRQVSVVHDLLGAGLDEGRESFGPRFMRWMRDRYGYYIEVSEGDAIWRYDKRALREFLKLYPDHPQASAVAFVLVREDLLHREYDPAVFFVRDARALACAREFIARYQEILRRYPRSEKRSQIESEIAMFRSYLKSGGPLPGPWH